MEDHLNFRIPIPLKFQIDGYYTYGIQTKFGPNA